MLCVKFTRPKPFVPRQKRRRRVDNRLPAFLMRSLENSLSKAVGGNPFVDSEGTADGENDKEGERLRVCVTKRVETRQVLVVRSR